MSKDTSDPERSGSDSSVQRRRFLQGVGATAAQSEGELTPIGQLLADMPDNWGRWGEDDELGMLNELGSAAK